MDTYTITIEPTSNPSNVTIKLYMRGDPYPRRVIVRPYKRAQLELRNLTAFFPVTEIDDRTNLVVTTLAPTA